MSEQTKRSGLLVKYVPEDIIGVSVLPQSNCSNVATYLMLKLVQAFEGFDLLSLF
jgi:hypothetical protein